MRGRDFIRVEGPLAPSQAGALAARVREELTDEVTAEAERILAEAEARWPIRTGRSRDGLYLRDDSAAATIILRIGNSVDYARFIRSAKMGRKPSPNFRPVLTRELGDPVRAARKALPQRAADVVAAVIEGAA